MKCISMLILVLLLNRAVQYARCHTVYIIPTADSPCPGAIIRQPCFTLEQYVANPSHSANITLQLYPGNHSMDHAPLATLKVDSFTMRATKPASVSVVCGQLQQLPPGNYFWFTFTGVSTVNISDITFNGCKFGIVAGETDILVNVAFMRSSFVNNTCCNNGGVLDITTTVTTSLVTVKECVFSDNNLGSIAVIYNYGNYLTVDQSVFKNNFVIGRSASYDGGGAIYHTGRVHLNILNSNFSNNEIANIVLMVELSISVVQGAQ